MNIRLYRTHLAFTPRFGFLLLTLFGMLLFTSLGYWQLHRADEKQQLLTTYQRNSEASPIRLAALDNSPSSLHYRQLKVSGHFDTQHQLLLDNRFSNHHLGYHVITALRIDNSDRLLLVNRGWIKRSDKRDQLPIFNTPTARISVIGYIDQPPKKHFTLGQQQDNPGQWPAVIQNLDMNQIASLFGKPLYPFVIKLHPDNQYGFDRQWAQVTTMPPERHHGYAFQWFALALAVLIVFIVCNCKRVEK